jgi:hypothetical protein
MHEFSNFKDEFAEFKRTHMRMIGEFKYFRDENKALRTTNENLVKHIKLLDGDKVGELLLKNKADINYLHHRTRAILSKVIVATEVVNVSSQKNKGYFAMNVIQAFDESDEWWLAKEHLSLRQWMLSFVDKPKVRKRK